MAARGLPLSRYDVLLNLAEAPGGRLRMQELSASVLLSKSGLSRLVDRMVAAGLVRRERCEDDRRGWFAVLTDQGRSALAAPPRSTCAASTSTSPATCPPRRSRS